MKPGCVNEPTKCTKIAGTDNCKVTGECYCGSVTASEAGDICSDFDGIEPKNAEKCSGATDSNCTSASGSADCTIKS